MDNYGTLREEIIDRVYYFTDEEESTLNDEQKEEVLTNAYRTKDKQVAAYLKALGYIFRGA
jgi:Tfp pilus assembly protein PilO